MLPSLYKTSMQQVHHSNDPNTLDHNFLSQVLFQFQYLQMEFDISLLSQVSVHVSVQALVKVLVLNQKLREM
jgi:hypothetical protein